jgi:hypothetical protein
VRRPRLSRDRDAARAIEGWENPVYRASGLEGTYAGSPTRSCCACSHRAIPADAAGASPEENVNALAAQVEIDAPREGETSL